MIYLRPRFTLAPQLCLPLSEANTNHIRNPLTSGEVPDGCHIDCPHFLFPGSLNYIFPCLLKNIGRPHLHNSKATANRALGAWTRIGNVFAFQTIRRVSRSVWLSFSCQMACELLKSYGPRCEEVMSESISTLSCSAP